MKLRQFLSIALICASLHGCKLTQQYNISGPLTVTLGSTVSQTDRYKQFLDSAVLVSVLLDDSRTGTGSGVVLHAGKGIILTVAHLLPENVATVVIQVDRGLTYEVCKWDTFPEHDLAILYCEKSIRATSVVVAKTEPILGESVVVTGSPYGNDYFNTLSFGRITAKNRYNPTVQDAKLYQTDALIVRGSSGGPWFNGAGQVIGITFWTGDTSGNIGLCVPLPSILKVLQENIDGN